MELTDAYKALGQSRFDSLVGAVSIGALKTYSVYESFKVRIHLNKLNRQRLRRAAPKLWERISDGDDILARDFAQAVLVSNIDLVVDVLDFLDIPHDGNGFFDKDADPGEKLSDGWPQRVFEKFRERNEHEVVLLYINHLGWEMDKLDKPFIGDS